MNTTRRYKARQTISSNDVIVSLLVLLLNVRTSNEGSFNIFSHQSIPARFALFTTYIIACPPPPLPRFFTPLIPRCSHFVTALEMS